MRQWLRQMRKDLHLTEKQVAEAIGIKQAPYHRIETGQSSPRVENAKKIGNLLGFDWKLFYPDEQQKVG